MGRDMGFDEDERQTEGNGIISMRMRDLYGMLGEVGKSRGLKI